MGKFCLFLFFVVIYGGCAVKPPAVALKGNIDALFGPATAVLQGQGATEEIQRALQPKAEHKFLERMVGDWVITGESGRKSVPYQEEAEIKWVMDGRWLQVIIRDVGAVAEKSLVYLGYDSYRQAYVYFQIGNSYTSPQIRVGEIAEARNGLVFKRHFTINHQGRETPLSDRLNIEFEEGAFSWSAYETIGAEAEWRMYHSKFRKKQ